MSTGETSRFALGMLRPLAIRDFALLWAGMTVSLLGDGIYFVTIAWQVYELSNAPTALAVVGIAWTLPLFLFLLVGGVVSDRFDVLGLVYIEFEDGGFWVEASGRSLGETSGAAEAAKDDLRPLLLGHLGRRVGYRAPVQDPGNQYLLAFEQSAHRAS